MEEEDRLSNLPIIILHDILSRLPIKYVVLTSVLSKSWANTSSTFPNLFFRDTCIIGEKKKNLIESEDYLGKRKKFLGYVDKTLLRFRNQGLSIKQFTLSLKCFDLHNLSKDVDFWLKLVSESGVEVLKLWQPLDEREEEEVNNKCYILPTCVLEAKSLTKLVLRRKIGVDLSLIDRSIKFFTIQYLYLDDVVLRDEHTLQHLIYSCPLVEYITLGKCYVLKPDDDGNGEWCLHESISSRMKSVCMCGLPRLKEALVLGIREVCVDSTCLEKLGYIPFNWEEPSKIDFDKCKNLRQLSLWTLESTIITSKWFLELFSKFPFLDTVKLERCRMSETICISSVQLKVLSLISCRNLKEVKIDAPNLLSCDYQGYPTQNSLCFLRDSSHAMVHIFELTDGLDLVDFQVPSSLPPSIKHLDLQVELQEEALYLRIVYRLLSYCCPTTISVCLDSFCCRKFIEFLYVTLMERNNGFGCYDESCHYGHSKCWLHRLKDVKLESPMKVETKVDFKNMLDKFDNSERDVIFKLEF